MIPLYSISLLVFITEAECVYCAVRNGSLNKTVSSWRRGNAIRQEIRAGKKGIKKWKGVKDKGQVRKYSSINFRRLYQDLVQTWLVMHCIGITNLIGKAILLQALTGPECPGSLRVHISRQPAHESGKVVSPTHRPPLPPGNIPATHFY
jgi:hypothetical protein